MSRKGTYGIVILLCKVHNKSDGEQRLQPNAVARRLMHTECKEVSNIKAFKTHAWHERDIWLSR